MLEDFPRHAHPLSSIHPLIIQDSPPFQPVICSHSFHPEHFPFFHPLSICFLFFPPLFFLLFLPASLSVFWTFLLVLSISIHPASPPPFPPPSFPCDEWVCLLGAVHIYWAGERTLSVSLALHISIPPLKRQREQEVTVGWEEEGGRGQEIHSKSHHDSSWFGEEHISLGQHSLYSASIRGGWGREKSSLPLDQPVNVVILIGNKQRLSIPLCATRQPTLSTQCNTI